MSAHNSLNSFHNLRLIPGYIIIGFLHHINQEHQLKRVDIPTPSGIRQPISYICKGLFQLLPCLGILFILLQILFKIEHTIRKQDVQLFGKKLLYSIILKSQCLDVILQLSSGSYDFHRQ